MTHRVKLVPALVFALLALGFTSNAKAQIRESRRTHEIAIFDEGATALRWRLERIAQARETIDIDYFIYKGDASSRIFTQALAAKARQGVRVRLLLDGLPSTNAVTDHAVQEFARHGIEVRHYNKVFLLRLRASKRTHRKNIIIDGKEFITGGRNIEDKYFSLSPDLNFLDRDVWVRGPIAAQVREDFELQWNARWSKPVSAPMVPRYSGGGPRDNGTSFAQYSSQKRAYAAGQASAQQFFSIDDVNDRSWAKRRSMAGVPFFTVNHVVYVSDLPHPDRRTNLLRVYTENLMWNARRKITMETPYFILNERTFDFFEQLGRRNLDITVLTNSVPSTDNVLTSSVHYAQAKRMLETGIEVHNYDGTAPMSELGQYRNRAVLDATWTIHAKTFVIDDTVGIGTKNMDPRSQDINIENMVFFPNNREVADYMRERIASRMQRADRVVEWTSEGEVRRLMGACDSLGLMGCMKLKVFRFFGLLFIDLL
jgi:putative cardiolipin synthase